MRIQYFSPVILLYSVFLVAAANLQAQEPEIVSEIDRDRIYQGESLTYNVLVNHVDNPPEPQFEGLDQFDVDLVGKQSQNSRQITIINGRRREEVRQGMLFQFRLTPTVAGELVIPGPSVVVGGERIVGSSRRVTVVAPQDQSVVLLEMSIDKPSVYALQPFRVTLDMLVRELPGEFSEVSPLEIQSRARTRNAALSLPWLADESLSDRLQPSNKINAIVEPIISRTTEGFTINDLSLNGGGFLFSRRREAVFLPPYETVTRDLPSGEAATYRRYSISREFAAKRVGPIPFEAANVKGLFAIDIGDDGRINAEEIYAISNRLVLNVKSPPLSERPASYTGAIGRFDLAATLTPVDARVGDPLTLVLTVSGVGTIDDIRPPDLSAIDELSADFRIYEPSEETFAQGRKFTYSLRAERAGIDQLPPIPFSWFDVESEQYREAETEAIPVTISATQELASGDIVAGEIRPVPKGQFQKNDDGLLANHGLANVISVSRMSFSDWLALWGGLATSSFALSYVLRRQRRSRNDFGKTRRKNAIGRARKELNRLTQQSATGQQHEGVSRVIKELIGDLLNVDSAGLTSDDTLSLMIGAEVTEDTRATTEKLLSTCDAARYGGGMMDDELMTQCFNVVAQLESELGRIR